MIDRPLASIRTTPLPGETCAVVRPGVDTTSWWWKHRAAAWDRKYPAIANARMVGRPKAADKPPRRVCGVFAAWLLRDVRPAWLNRARAQVLRAVGAPR